MCGASMSSPIILRREIGLHRCGNIESALVIKRPAAMLALDAAQIDRRSCAPARDWAFRPGNAPAGHIPPGWWRRLPAHRPNGRPAAARASSPSVAALMARSNSALGNRGVHGADYRLRWRLAKRAAVSPERMAPSMVAGSPVWVQSPARKILRMGRAAPGRRASSGRSGGEGGALSP